MCIHLRWEIVCCNGDSVVARVAAACAAGKTLHLGSVVYETLSVIRQVFDKAFIFPMGATAKPLEPDKLRPTSDHTRTGLKPPKPDQNPHENPQILADECTCDTATT